MKADLLRGVCAYDDLSFTSKACTKSRWSGEATLHHNSLKSRTAPLEPRHKQGVSEFWQSFGSNSCKSLGKSELSLSLGSRATFQLIYREQTRHIRRNTHKKTGEKFPVSALVGVFVGTPRCVLHSNPQLSWAFQWTSSCTLPCAFSAQPARATRVKPPLS